MSAFLQALFASPPQLAAGPLRTLRYDDQDYRFFTYAGTWYQANGNWAGEGSYLSTVTFRNSVVPSETRPTATTKVIPFLGTPEEGFDLWGASEDGGPFLLFIRALDQVNTGWVQFGTPIGSGTYLYQWKVANLATDPVGDVNRYNVTYLNQSYYDRLSNPGLIRLRGLPAGQYQFRIEKPANTNDPNDTGNKALYFDGATVHTRHPTFS